MLIRRTAMIALKSLALTLALTAGLSNLAYGETAETRAEKEYALTLAVATASRTWRDAFNAGDAAAAAELYEEDAIMVVKPFGTFKGRKAIQAFWTDIIAKGFDDVVYRNTVTTILDPSLTSARVSADWKNEQCARSDHQRALGSSVRWACLAARRSL